MGSSLTPDVKKRLLAAGCRFERAGKGDHEIWFSPISNRRFVVDNCILSRRDGLEDVFLAGRSAERCAGSNGCTGRVRGRQNAGL